MDEIDTKDDRDEPSSFRAYDLKRSADPIPGATGIVDTEVESTTPSPVAVTPEPVSPRAGVAISTTMATTSSKYDMKSPSFQRTIPPSPSSNTKNLGLSLDRRSSWRAPTDWQDPQRRSIVSSATKIDLGLSSAPPPPMMDDQQSDAGSTEPSQIRPAEASDWDPPAPRECRCAPPLFEMLRSPWFSLVSGIFTLFALFASDFTAAILPLRFDLGAAIVLTASLIFMLIEVGLTIGAQRNYVFGFYFWLDIVGLMSLIPDIPWLYTFLKIQNLGLTVARAGRAARVSRSSRSVRLSRLIRIVKMARIARIFKYFRKTLRDDDTGSNPSRVGAALTDRVSKKVIVMTLLLLLVIPALERTDDAPNRGWGLDIVHDISNRTQAMESARIYMDTIGIEDTLFLYVEGDAGPFTIVPMDYERLKSIREVEIEKYMIDNTKTEAWFSIADFVRSSALFNLILTLVVVVVFALGSWLLSRDANKMLVQPVERMTGVIRKLAGTVCLLSPPDEGMEMVSAGMEMQVIEEIVEKMAIIFKVLPDTRVTANKAFRVLAGKRHTEIQTKNSIVCIDVAERPLVRRRKARDSREDGDSVMEDLPHVDVDFKTNPELTSLNALLQDDLALGHFKQFLSGKFSQELLMFWNEAQTYASRFADHARRVYEWYIAPGSPNEVNIDAQQKKRISDMLNRPTADMFETARAEVFKLMTGCFNEFLSSQACKYYLAIKHRSRVTITSSAGSLS